MHITGVPLHDYLAKNSKQTGIMAKPSRWDCGKSE